MAATNEVHPPEPSQQALLSLERSSSPFPEQLDEASRILGVDFGSLQSPPPAPQRAAAVPSAGATAAKSDWVLRWLLNKLRASGESGAIIRSNVRAWQLLRHVVRSLPTSSAARSLNAHGFLQILRSALDEINVACATLDRPRAGQSPRDVKPVTQGLDKIGSTAAADSSSTAVDSPEDVPLRSSRKRKRSKSTTVEQEPVQPTAQRHCDLQLLTSALLDVVTLIVDCFGGSSDTAQTPSVDYSKEHMKSVLRSNPDDAGNLVGSSLRLLHQLFRNNRCQPFDSAFFSVPSWALAVNAIWQNRSVNIDDIDGNIGHDAFSSHCLRPGLAILRLHQRNITVGVGADEVVAVLERLMSRHIIAPGRTSFVESITTSASDLTIENLFEAGRRLSTLLEPLRVGTELAKGSSQQLQGASMTFEDSLDNSLMFDLAFRSSPLLRRSKVAKERLWIETVFVVLLEAAGIKLSAEELPPLDDDHSRVLESLLRIAVDRGVALSTTTLQLVTIRCTRLFSQEPNWRLLELIIQLDGDVFLAPLRDGALRTFCESPSKILVDPLFARLTAFAKSEADVVSDADRGLVQMKILIPLVDAFAHARKSIDFLACWHRELTQLEEARLLAGKSENKSGLTITILEDALLIDKLQRQLLKSIEIQDLIKRMEQDVSTVDLPEAADVQTKARSFASLVLLDACHPVLVQSWNGESLHELIFPMFRVVMKNTISDTWSQSHRWRLWRVLATIQELCPDFSSSVASRDHTEVYESYGKALNMGQETFKATVASITGLRQSFERNIRTWDLFEIFRFVSSSVAHLPRIHEQSKANISEVYQSMIQDSCELLERSSEASDETGRMGDSNLCLEGQKDYRNANQQSMSWKPLCVAFATEIFLRHPEILMYDLDVASSSQLMKTRLAPSTDRRRLLRLCYSRAGVSALASLSEESGPIVTMGDVWTGTVTNNLLLNCVELKGQGTAFHLRM
ncbi:MAG: hypothetical protein M1833_003843 [Piccolia ochrophora]|nr:MAG: hypothetical protein M1833_003843 [Piccolia ochrophora]